MKPMLLALLGLFADTATAAAPPAWQSLDTPALDALRNPAAIALQAHPYRRGRTAAGR